MDGDDLCGVKHGAVGIEGGRRITFEHGDGLCGVMNGAVGIEGDRVVALVDGDDLYGVKHGAVGIEGGRQMLHHVNNFRIKNNFNNNHVHHSNKSIVHL